MSLEGPTDNFRAYDEILVADARWNAIVVPDGSGPGWRDKTLSDHYEEIAVLVLPDHVPRTIRGQFDNARNLLLHSWFVYRFCMTAELVAYSSAEYALRERILPEQLGRSGSSTPTFREMLSYAVAQGWFADDRFRTYQRSREWRSEFLEKMRERESSDLSSSEYGQIHTDPDW